MQKIALITGITGQDGAYLSKFLLEKGYGIIGIIRPDCDENYYGLNYLKVFDKIKFVKCNLLDKKSVANIFKEYHPDEIYNLAAQSSVGYSFENPQETIQFNILSVLNILEGIRKDNRKIKLYQASSSDMFGNIDSLPVTENSVIHPTSPYGISKASGHWMAINYRESYGLYVCCGILFNHESYLRTPNFFVKKIIRNSLDIKKGLQSELRVGDIDLRRDFGFAPDYVKAMWLMLQQAEPKDYLICSGQSISLREIIYYVFEKLDIDRNKLVIDSSFYRPNDIANIYGNNMKAKEELGWDYNKTFFEVLDLLIEEEMKNTKI